MRPIVSTSVLLSGLVLGCNSQPSAPTSDPADAAAAPKVGLAGAGRRAPVDKKASPPLALLTVQVSKLHGDGEETIEIAREFRDPDAKLIREHVKALDWANPKLRPLVGVRFVGTSQRTAIANAEKGVLSINGGLNIAHPDGSFRATLVGSAEGYHSEALKSLDEAIELLISFRNGDEKWQTLTKWTQFQ